MEAWTDGPYYRRHFQVHLLEWKWLYSDTDKGPNNDIPAFVQAMAWHRTVDMSPSEPKMPKNDWRVYASLRRDEFLTYAHKYVATMVHRNID